MVDVSAASPLLTRALSLVTDLASHVDKHGHLPAGFSAFFDAVHGLQARGSSSSSTSLALTEENLRALKRPRTEITVTPPPSVIEPLHPAPEPEVVILRLAELPTPV